MGRISFFIFFSGSAGKSNRCAAQPIAQAGARGQRGRGRLLAGIALGGRGPPTEIALANRFTIALAGRRSLRRPDRLSAGNPLVRYQESPSLIVGSRMTSMPF